MFWGVVVNFSQITEDRTIEKDFRTRVKQQVGTLEQHVETTSWNNRLEQQVVEQQAVGTAR